MRDKKAHAVYMAKWRRKTGPEYQVWQNIFLRCRATHRPDYKNYGGRGITPCLGIATFKAFISVVGRRPSNKHTIDRVDNDGGYWCGSCRECLAAGRPCNMRWATRKENNQNKRNVTLITWNDRTQSVTAWATEFGMKAKNLLWRLQRWPLERAMTTKPRKDRRRKRTPQLIG